MEYQLELAPFQILLNLEMYTYLKQFTSIEIDKMEIQKIKNSVKIIGLNKKKFLTKIDISYFSQTIKSALISITDNFFGENNSLETHLESTYKHIVSKSQSLPHTEEFCSFLNIYLKEVSNTLIIDFYSDHFAELIKYMINMGLREEYSGIPLKILTNTVLNDLLSPIRDKSLLMKHLKNQFWISSRHLSLVTNTYIPLNEKIQDLPMSKENLVKKLSKRLPSQIVYEFHKYLNFVWTLNALKLLDSQIQIRASFLLKKNLGNYMKINNKFFNYGWDIQYAKEIIHKIIHDCQELIMG